MGNKIRVGITHGDINGIGPEVALKALADERVLDLMTPVLYSSSRIVQHYRKACELPHIKFNISDTADNIVADAVNLVNVVDESAKIETGTPTKEGGEAAFASLERAVADLRAGLVDVLVTAPIDKKTIQSPTFTFPGHTEYLESSLSEPGRDKALMMMVAGNLRVALLTAHTSINKVQEGVTADAIRQRLATLNRALVEDFGIATPRIAVLALNPHAGEEGLLGSEEHDIIAPAIAEANDAGVLCFGPYAADGFFGAGQWTRFDAVLAMYHDQGLAPFKTLAMDAGVNFTAGLPYVRTSPDHGTAFDIAGTGKADEQSMREAIYLALDIERNRRRYAEFSANPLKKQVAEKRKQAPKADKPTKSPKDNQAEAPDAEALPETTAEE